MQKDIRKLSFELFFVKYIKKVKQFPSLTHITKTFWVYCLPLLILSGCGLTSDMSVQKNGITIQSFYLFQDEYKWSEVDKVDLRHVTSTPGLKGPGNKPRLNPLYKLHFFDGKEIELSFSEDKEDVIDYIHSQVLNTNPSIQVNAECINPTEIKRIKEQFQSPNEQLVLKLFPQCD
jgi:hypothetical protein